MIYLCRFEQIYDILIINDYNSGDKFFKLLYKNTVSIYIVFKTIIYTYFYIN